MHAFSQGRFGMQLFLLNTHRRGRSCASMAVGIMNSQPTTDANPLTSSSPRHQPQKPPAPCSIILRRLLVLLLPVAPLAIPAGSAHAQGAWQQGEFVIGTWYDPLVGLESYRTAKAGG